jgi:hypothetical protein
MPGTVRIELGKPAKTEQKDTPIVQSYFSQTASSGPVGTPVLGVPAWAVKNFFHRLSTDAAGRKIVPLVTTVSSPKFPTKIVIPRTPQIPEHPTRRHLFRPYFCLNSWPDHF